MNQIICTSSTSLDITNFKKRYKRKNILRFEFYLLFIICILLLIYYINFRYNLYIAKNISKNLSDSYKITKIYKISENNSEPYQNDQIILYENNSFEIIGIIEIKKIGISYPILSDINKDFLKIAPCRIYGPMPNEIRQFVYCCT